MDKRKKFLRILLRVLSSATVAVPLLMYHLLLISNVKGAMLYGKVSYLLVMIVSVLFSFVPLLLWREAPEVQKGEDEEKWVYTPSEESFEESENVAIATEEYPELFLNKEAGEEKSEKAEAPSYLEAIEKAMASQKAEYIPEEAEINFSDDDIFSFEKSEDEEKIPDIYSDIPDTLPKGYEMLEEPWEEEEETDEPQSIFAERRGMKIKKIAATVLSFLIPLSVAFAMSKNYVVYDEDGFTVSTPFEKKDYLWQFCRSYEIAPSFFGDSLSFVLYMNDGEKIELLPTDLRIDNSFYEKYASEYAYSVAVSEKLIRAGAAKTVKEKNTIESSLALREDIGEYVKKLIE